MITSELRSVRSVYLDGRERRRRSERMQQLRGIVQQIRPAPHISRHYCPVSPTSPTKPQPQFQNTKPVTKKLATSPNPPISNHHRPTSPNCSFTLKAAPRITQNLHTPKFKPTKPCTTNTGSKLRRKQASGLRFEGVYHNQAYELRCGRESQLLIVVKTQTPLL